MRKGIFALLTAAGMAASTAHADTLADGDIFHVTTQIRMAGSGEWLTGDRTECVMGHTCRAYVRGEYKGEPTSYAAVVRSRREGKLTIETSAAARVSSHSTQAEEVTATVGQTVELPVMLRWIEVEEIKWVDGRPQLPEGGPKASQREETIAQLRVTID